MPDARRSRDRHPRSGHCRFAIALPDTRRYPRSQLTCSPVLDQHGALASNLERLTARPHSSAGVFFSRKKGVCESPFLGGAFLGASNPLSTTSPPSLTLSPTSNALPASSPLKASLYRYSARGRSDSTSDDLEVSVGSQGKNRTQQRGTPKHERRRAQRTRG